MYDVVCRYFFNLPSPFASYVASFMILGAVFIGAGYSFQVGAQVHIEIVVDKLPPLPRRICFTVGYCLALFFIGVMVRESWIMTKKAFASNWKVVGNVPLPSGYLYGIMAFGCIILFVTIVLKLVFLWKQKDSSTEVKR